MREDTGWGFEGVPPPHGSLSHDPGLLSPYYFSPPELYA